MTFRLLTEHHLEFLSLKGGYTGSSESTLVKIPHCWKSHVTEHITSSSIFYSQGSKADLSTGFLFRSIATAWDLRPLENFQPPHVVHLKLLKKTNIYNDTTTGNIYTIKRNMCNLEHLMHTFNIYRLLDFVT